MVAADDGGASAGQSPLLYVRWAGCPCGPVCLPVCLCVCTSLCVPPCVPVCAGVHLPLCASVSVRAFPSRYAALGRTRGPGTRTSAFSWSTLALLLYHEEPKDKYQKNNPRDSGPFLKASKRQGNNMYICNCANV